jgi:hypothetical protein
MLKLRVEPGTLLGPLVDVSGVLTQSVFESMQGDISQRSREPHDAGFSKRCDYIQSAVSRWKSLAFTPMMAWAVTNWYSVPTGQTHVSTSAKPQLVRLMGAANAQVRVARTPQRVDDLMLVDSVVTR